MSNCILPQPMKSFQFLLLPVMHFERVGKTIVASLNTLSLADVFYWLK